MHNPCFKALAEAMGARGLIARTDAELEVAMDEFVSYNDGPIVLDASVCKHEHVYVRPFTWRRVLGLIILASLYRYPMVPAGAALDDMVYHPSLQG